MEPRSPIEPYNDYDEIDLRDIFRTLGKWKKTIASVTLIFMLVSGIYSFLIATPVYEAKAVVAPAKINPIGIPNNLTYIVSNRDSDNRQNMLDNMDNIVQLTQLDNSCYQAIITNDNVLAETVRDLKLTYNPVALKGLIKVEQKKDNPNVTDIIEISVQDPNPKLAAQIANTLVKKTNIYISDFNDKSMNKLGKALELQLNTAQDDLSRATVDLKQYQSTPSIKSQVEEKRLQNNVDRRQNIVDSLNSKILELQVQQALYESQDQMVVLSSATASGTPVKPNKTLNIAIAGILGLMVSIFGVFLAEYMGKE